MSPDRKWELVGLIALSFACFMVMFGGVAEWKDLSEPQEAALKVVQRGSVVEFQPWIAGGQYGAPQVKEIEEEDGVLSRLRAYVDRLRGVVGNEVHTPGSVWEEKERRPVRELGFESNFLHQEDGVVENAKSFITGIRDSITHWGQQKRTAPSILHATEPLGRVNPSAMSSTSGLSAKLTAIVGKVMEDFYATAVVTQEGATCSGILEEQTKKLVKSLKSQLKEKLCDSSDNSAVAEQEFCKFFKDHPKLATLMVFSKLELNVVGVALMRTSTSGLCATTISGANGDLLDNVHLLERLSRRLHVESLIAVPLEGLEHGGLHLEEHKSGEHEHGRHHHEEHEDEESKSEEQDDEDRKPESSCEGCFRQGIHRLGKGLKMRLSTVCSFSLCPKIVAACQFAKEHKFLAKTYLITKTQLWDIAAFQCGHICSSSPSSMFNLGMHSDGLHSHAPSHRLQDFKRALISEHPDMGTSQTLGDLAMRHKRFLGCKNRMAAREQAFRSAMRLRGHFLGRSQSGDNVFEGNGQRHLVVVVNGHPFGPTNFHEMFTDLHKHMSELVVASMAHESESTPTSASEEVFVKSVHIPEGMDWTHGGRGFGGIHTEPKVKRPAIGESYEDISTTEFGTAPSEKSTWRPAPEAVETVDFTPAADSVPTLETDDVSVAKVESPKVELNDESTEAENVDGVRAAM